MATLSEGDGMLRCTLNYRLMHPLTLFQSIDLHCKRKTYLKMNLKVFLLLNLIVIATGKKHKTNAYKYLQELLLNHYKNVDSVIHDKFRESCPIWSKDRNLDGNEEKMDLNRFFSSSHQIPLRYKSSPQADDAQKTDEKQKYKNTAKMIVQGLLDKCKGAFINMKKYSAVFDDDPTGTIDFFDPQEIIKCIQVV
ncbi:unnamed protein product, partial [Brenthis ino]